MRPCSRCIHPHPAHRAQADREPAVPHREDSDVCTHDPQRSEHGAPPTAAPEVADLRARPTAEVVVIGGINGIATFRDLALQGVDVVLVERDDFVSGASSASSHMIHGGIRYLENGEFRLVQESVEERN